MAGLVSYERDGAIAVITLDDGKVNALSPQLQAALNDALDRADTDQVIPVIAGRPGVFSAGFDLRVLRAGGEDALAMVRGGFDIAVRLLSFPRPVVAACTGHAIAMAAFLLLSADYRIGAAGPYRITANEVAIGMTLPRSAIEICRQRLAQAHLTRATALAEVYTPEAAVAAGFLDRVAGEGELAGVARDVARQLSALDMSAHAATKLRLREQTLEAMHAAMALDYAAVAGGAAAPAHSSDS